MSSALYIVPEREIPGFDHSVNGKALAGSEQLDELAERAGVKPLMAFFSQDPEEAEGFLEAEGIEMPPGGLPDEQWFSPEEGLATVRALLQHLGTAVPDAPAIAADLRGFESVLSRLATKGLRWHLAVDF